MAKRRKRRKDDGLSRHRERTCHCFSKKKREEVRCNYQEFVDGWSFVPDSGNAKSRGEIFTPSWVVEKMIVDSGMLPKEAVYRGDYTKAKESYVASRVNEPAVGTGNYIATVLYHKLRFAKSLASDGKNLDLEQYHSYLLTAVASVYAYDIDVGNLETSKRRLLGSDQKKINNKKVIEWWLDYLLSALQVEDERNSILAFVEGSLNEAQENWQPFLAANEGVIDRAYREAVGESMPQGLRKKLGDILFENMKLFDGTKDEDTIDFINDFFCPGRASVVWTWWDFPKGEEPWNKASKRKVPLLAQLQE